MLELIELLVVLDEAEKAPAGHHQDLTCAKLQMSIGVSGVNRIVASGHKNMQKSGRADAITGSGYAGTVRARRSH